MPRQFCELLKEVLEERDGPVKRKDAERRSEIERSVRTGEEKRCSLDSLQSGPLRLQAEKGVTVESMSA